MEYEPVIGIEVHAQLLTKSKMFCGCSTDYMGAPPNTHVCPVCLGMPGVLPVINRRAVEYTIMAGLALNCQVPEATKWDRKNYHYPDLPKGYQISQYDLPLTRDGWLEIDLEGVRKRIGIRRVHLEEDTAKLFHEEGYALVDFNRSGVPLLEIVSEPDLRSIEEVRQYVTKLRIILRYLGVSSGDMEKGAMRFEVNISLRPRGDEEYGTRVEIKNLNSFRAVLNSLGYEIERQKEILRSGGKIEQETMGWDEVRGTTFPQRSKEYAHDYRYFPEPDLPPLELEREWIESIKARLPELPDAKRQRFIKEYGLSEYDAGVLTAEKAVADIFEEYVKAYPSNPTAVAHWMTREVFSRLKEGQLSAEKVLDTFSPPYIGELLEMQEGGLITSGSAVQITQRYVVGEERPPRRIVEEEGLAQISDEERLGAMVEVVLEDNPKAVADYLGGKEGALRYLVGQVMKATKGKANPALANKLLKERLEEKGRSVGKEE
jgi:aspartyl-tRNA(Asn)/glutamyl-tRNA(Gln) amidotransferase subunit B